MMWCNNCGGYILGYDELEPVGQNECVCDNRETDCDKDFDCDNGKRFIKYEDNQGNVMYKENSFDMNNNKLVNTNMILSEMNLGNKFEDEREDVFPNLICKVCNMEYPNCVCGSNDYKERVKNG